MIKKNVTRKEKKIYEKPIITIYPIESIPFLAASPSSSTEIQGPGVSEEEESASGGRAKRNDMSEDSWDDVWDNNNIMWDF